MYKYIFILISFIIWFGGCGTNSKKGEGEISMNQVDSLNEVKKRVLQGDTNSYYSLRVAYLDNEIGGLLPWSLLMANKYNYSPAYYDVYYIVMINRNLDLYALDSLDKKTKDIALYYLLMAAKMHEPNAINTLKRLKPTDIDNFPHCFIDSPIASTINFDLK